MRSTMYLYGVNPIDFADMKYRDALEFKVIAAKKVMAIVGHEASKVIHLPDQYIPLLHRYEAADKAKQFNQDLLQELNE